MKIIKNIFIGGNWVASASDNTLGVVNPSNEEIIATVPACTALDTEKAIRSAHAALPLWRATTSSERSDILLKIASIMERRSEELAITISESMGCPLDTTRWLQVQDSIDVIKHFAQHTNLTDQEEQIGNSIVVREPIGVCAIINPWNIPLYQLVAKVGAALAAGCTMVVKPAEQTPLQDFIFAEILAEAGVPAGVFNLVTGTGQEVGSVLSSHPLVRMVSFTGSTQAGSLVSIAAAKSVKRVTLELGGKSPFIITEDADLESALEYGVADIMLNSGQVCTALSRMLIPRAHYKKAQNIVAALVNKLVVSDQPDADMGPLASLDHWHKVQGYIELGTSEGAELICGGLGKPDGLETGFFVRPTVFTNVDNAMKIAQEEIFGPVLCMIPYDTIEQAIEIANDTSYGLNSAVYASSQELGIKIARQIDAGLCHINGGQLNLQAPFGGYKQSGNGRELSAVGVEEYLEIKSMQLPI